MLQRRWNIIDYDKEKAISLQKELKINAAICRILVQRNICTFEESRQFFRPALSMLHDPFLMKDMDKAVNRVMSAISANEKILVFGDYDVDGTTSVAVMYSFLLQIYSEDNVDFYVPHRYREGYGVSKEGIDYAYASGCKLIICLDCGIKSVELIDYAASLGIDFIICDHHLPGSEIPRAVAVLNPKQSDCNYPFKDLCGCGVGFKLVSAIAESLNLPPETCYQYLDLVATAIAADIVPMNGENRVLAYFGLQKINKDPSIGIKALMTLAGIQKEMTITNVVFVIAPRVNAAGRMDDAKKAVQMFIEKDPGKALEFAGFLHSDNSERKLADSSITQEALEMMNGDASSIARKSSVVFKETWHKGVVGIVASRLMEHYYRPTVVLTKSGNIVAGSARSVHGFNLYEAVYECRELLLAYGGHYAAAGLSMLPENVEAFSKRFDEVVSATIEDRFLIPEIIIDAELNFSDISLSFFSIISQMEPFGPENMRPVFLSRNVSDSGYSRILKENHIKFSMKQNDNILNGIGFNMAHLFPLIHSASYINKMGCVYPWKKIV